MQQSEKNILLDVLGKISRNPMDCQQAALSNSDSVFSTISSEEMSVVHQIIGVSNQNSFDWTILKVLVGKDDVCEVPYVDRCLGCYFGMLLGDYLGAPVEFLPCQDHSNSIDFVEPEVCSNCVIYPEVVRNVFSLEIGQWTDDASMGACIADSLLVHKCFVAKDVRSRFWNWWAVGYNNAFMLSETRRHRSVGLGGNISKSIAAINGLKYEDIPDKFVTSTQDSGNGGLMRLAPIPIFYSSSSVVDAMAFARFQSETTHPGDLASRAAEFLAFCIYRAINFDRNPAGSNVLTSSGQFLDIVVKEYLKSYCSTARKGNIHLRRLLQSQESSSSTEYSWNWRAEHLPILKCMKNRGDVYNGYANTPEYYGSYCMDGLAIALHSFMHSNSFESCLKLCISKRGDADSTASISGQLAGAFYGISSIRPQLVNNALQWDKAENLLRAVMLTPWYQGRDRTPENALASGTDLNSAEVDNDLPESRPHGIFGSIVTVVSKLLSNSIFSSAAPSGNGASEVFDAQTRLLQSSVTGDVELFRVSLLYLQSEAVLPVEHVLFSLDGEASSCLHLSAGNGRAELVDYIIELAQTQTRGVCLSFLNHKNDNNYTALLLALANGYEDIACKLLNAGAAAIGSVGKGRNALYLMARQGMISAMNLLLVRDGVEVVGKLASEADINGYNALHAAVLMGQRETAALLLGSIGLKMDSAAKDGSTVLHAASRSHLSKLNEDSALQFYELLVRNSHPDILSAQDSFGMTPLHSAANMSNKVLLRLILRYLYTSDNNSRDSKRLFQDDDGTHPTQTACNSLARKYESLEQLKYEKVDLDVQSAKEESLKQEVESATDCIAMLINAGYPLAAQDYSNGTILHSLCWAPYDGQLSILRDVVERIRAADMDGEMQLRNLVGVLNDDGFSCLHFVAKSKPAKKNGPAAPTSSYLQMRNDEVIELLRPFVSESFLRGCIDYPDDGSAASTSNGSKVRSYLLRRGPHNRISVSDRWSILKGDYSTRGLCSYLKSLPHTPRVVVVAGAGMSTSCGIKDFRSRDGLYADKSTAGLFTLQYLETQPRLFYETFHELFVPVLDKRIKPSKTHALLALLKQLGWLLRVYTQNIDMLEYEVGLSEDDIVECHGSCREAQCTKCSFRVTTRAAMETAFWSHVRLSKPPHCTACGSLLRPAITFFGEPMPERFLLANQDLPSCDLVMVIGTSLVVYPVAALPQSANSKAVRVLLNRESSGCFQFVPPSPPPVIIADDMREEHRQRHEKSIYRDIFLQGDCDTSAEGLADALGHSKDYEAIVEKYCQSS